MLFEAFAETAVSTFGGMLQRLIDGVHRLDTEAILGIENSPQQAAGYLLKPSALFYATSYGEFTQRG